MNTMKLKLNQPMQGYEAGRVVSVQADSAGVPLEKFWRRRLNDAKIDNCVEMVKDAPVKPKKESSK
jgi:hypothetical protein